MPVGLSVVPAMLDSLPSCGPHVRSGALRALAVSAAERSDALPGVPTLREGGLDVVSYAWFGISGPAGLPPELVKRWETETGTALRSDPVKEAFAKIGVRPGTLDSAGYTALIKAELARWKDVITAMNIKAD